MIGRRAFLKAIGLGLTSISALALYSGLIEPFMRLNTTRYRLTPKGWPEGLKLRLVVLADIHACNPWMPVERVSRLCDYANRLGGDAILLLGDYLSGMRLVTEHIPPERTAKALSGLRAPLGVHAILGNHDWWEDPEAQRLRLPEPAISKALAAVGIPVLSNRAVRLEKDGKPFWIAGLEDQLAYQNGYDVIGLDDLPATLAQVTDDAPVILMAHEPDIYPKVPERVALTLSGHTHGGQINLFGWRPIVPSDYGQRYAYGHIVEGERDLIVSGGLGCSILPIRFLSPPEVLIVELG